MGVQIVSCLGGDSFSAQVLSQVLRCCRGLRDTSSGLRDLLTLKPPLNAAADSLLVAWIAGLRNRLLGALPCPTPSPSQPSLLPAPGPLKTCGTLHSAASRGAERSLTQYSSRLLSGRRLFCTVDTWVIQCGLLRVRI